MIVVGCSVILVPSAGVVRVRRLPASWRGGARRPVAGRGDEAWRRRSAGSLERPTAGSRLRARRALTTSGPSRPLLGWPRGRLVLVLLIGVVAVLAVALVVGAGRRRVRRAGAAVPRRPLRPGPCRPGRGGTGPEEAPAEEAPVGRRRSRPALERPEATASRLVRLRQRLAGSQGALGRGLLALLSRDRLDEDTWEEIEDTLITADVGVGPTQELVERLRTRLRVEGADAADARTVLREELLTLVDPDHGPRPARHRSDGQARQWCSSSASTAPGRPPRWARSPGCWSPRTSTVVMGAADTFRAAATEQLTTWGERVGVEVVAGPEGSDPASVAFDAVQVRRRPGRRRRPRRHRRPAAEQGWADGRARQGQAGHREAGSRSREVLLVLDATTGQNGLVQARVFGEVVDVTGIVLTKLDGSAKGGIVVAVQRELGVPVKLVGLGEGARRPRAVRPGAFVDALLG